jgi:uncharacterized membrane protein YoaK (UPF0700 family)
MNPISRNLLALIAGFCDTATFIHMGGVFSAHVTGNFVLFAAAIAQGLQADDYLKIVTLPVFVIAVMVAMLIGGKHALPRQKVRRILIAITLLMLLAALLAVAGAQTTVGNRLGNLDVLITLLLVIAMAMQNTIHRFITGPMTTVMTGMVMNTTAGLVDQFILRTPGDAQKLPTTGVNPIIMIATFALGCLIAGFLTVRFGLASIALPAGVLCLVLVVEHRSPESA